MRSTAKIFLSLLLVILAFGYAHADPVDVTERARTRNRENTPELPRVASFMFRQVGATDLYLDIRGSGLPLPDVSSLVNRTDIVLRGVSGVGVQHHEEQGQGLNPLITSMNARQNGDDFVITIITERPVSPVAVRGVPPSDAYTLRFNTVEQVQRLIQAPMVIAQPPAPRVPTGPFASNAPITMDLRDTELRDVFRMLGQQLNMNIIIHDLPHVLVTMTFRDTPMRVVFDYLMRSYNITYNLLDPNTIVVGTAGGLSRISGREETRSFRVAYADPSAVQANLVRMTRISADDLVVDARLRTIFATASPDILEEVAVAIQTLDSPGRQVMIHARIIEFRETDTDEVITALNALYDRWHFSITSGGRLVVDNLFMRSAGDTLAPSFTIGDRTAPPLPNQPFGSPRYVRRVTAAGLDAVDMTLHARTLANPSVITIDGMEANIDLTQEIPYVSGISDGQMTWSTLNIGPRLTFTPVIGRDNTITLDLNLQASESGVPIPTQFGPMPTAVQRNVNTTVRVRNGEPFVVGGLYRTVEERTLVRIPILGQLPLLRNLFTRREVGTDTTQVVMVVIPYIIDTPDVGVEWSTVMSIQR